MKKTGVEKYLLKDAAEQIGIAPITLKRWFLAGKVEDVNRDRNGWRIFTRDDIKRIKRYADHTKSPHKQLPLMSSDLIKKGKNNKSATFRDSAFNGNKKLPFHRWVPWIAGFSANFVEDCFNKFISKDIPPSKITVLDPFAGVGTTLIEGIMHGYNVIGFEINPYAHLACKVKLNAYKYRIEDIEEALEKFLKYYKKRICDENHKTKSSIPEKFKTRSPFYSPAIERKILIFFDYLYNIKNLEVRDFFKLAFGTVMVSFSNYSYEPSLGRRVSSGKPDIADADIENIIADKIREMISDISEFEELHADNVKNIDIRLHNESIFDALTLCDPQKVDLVVTSPPYLNNYHYLRNTRPQLYWLDLVKDNRVIKTVENQSFGKFWQTVRGREQINIEFQHRELEKTLERLRRINREKKTYGGFGWANYAATYFNDSYRLCRVLKEMVKPGGIAVVVIGNSILQGIEIKTDEIFADIGEIAGLKKQEIILLRTKRTGSSIVDSSVRAVDTKKKTTLYETAVVLKKE